MLEAQTDSAYSKIQLIGDSLSTEAGITLPDSSSGNFKAALLHLKSEIRIKFPVRLTGNHLTASDIHKLSEYFFGEDELAAGLSAAQLYSYKKNKTDLNDVMLSIYKKIPDLSLGEFGKYLGIGKKAAAVILAVISLLTF